MSAPPSAIRDLGTGLQAPDEARAAALYVADQLNNEARPVLEALGLAGYVGHDIRHGRTIPVQRQGAIS